jgi:hypothetical protein
MKLVPLAGKPLQFDKPFCASLDGSRAPASA